MLSQSQGSNQNKMCMHWAYCLYSIDTPPSQRMGTPHGPRENSAHSKNVYKEKVDFSVWSKYGKPPASKIEEKRKRKKKSKESKTSPTQ